MKQRTTALLLAAALALSLLGVTALAEEGGAGSDMSAVFQEAAASAEEAGASTPEGESQDASAVDASGGKDAGEEDESGPDAPPAEEYIPDQLGSISFANLERRMHEGNLQIKALQESIAIIDEIDYDKLQNQLRYQLNELAKSQWSLVLASDFMSDYEYHSAYDQMDKAYDALRKQFDAIKDGDMQEDNADNKRQLQSLQNQIVVAGEATYVALAAMEIQEDGLERQLAALDRKVEELELRYELGHISSMALNEAKAGRTALSSGLSTLRMNLNAYKSQLELLVGAEITGKISLGPLPKVTQAELDGMELEKDLAAAKEHSWDIYQATEKMEEELKTYNGQGGEYGYTYKKDDSEYMRFRHNWYTAKYTYDNTIQSFELNLRKLHLKVQDYKQVLDASRTALAVEQDKYAAAQLKQSQGSLSQNALLDAEDKVKEAKEKVAGAENDLFSAYNTYRWAVDYGIMN